MAACHPPSPGRPAPPRSPYLLPPKGGRQPRPLAGDRRRPEAFARAFPFDPLVPIAAGLQDARGVSDTPCPAAFANSRQRSTHFAMADTQGMAKSSTRSLWKGAITFGLVHIPIGLYSATAETD